MSEKSDAEKLLTDLDEKLSTFTKQTLWADIKLQTSDGIDVFYSKWNLAKNSDYFVSMFGFNDKKGHNDKSEIFTFEETKNYSSKSVLLMILMLEDSSYIELFSLPKFVDENIETIRLVNFLQFKHLLENILNYVSKLKLSFDSINVFYIEEFTNGLYKATFAKTISSCVGSSCIAVANECNAKNVKKLFNTYFKSLENINESLYKEIIRALMHIITFSQEDS